LGGSWELGGLPGFGGWVSWGTIRSCYETALLKRAVPFSQKGSRRSKFNWAQVGVPTRSVENRSLLMYSTVHVTTTGPKASDTGPRQRPTDTWKTKANPNNTPSLEEKNETAPGETAKTALLLGVVMGVVIILYGRRHRRRRPPAPG